MSKHVLSFKTPDVVSDAIRDLPEKEAEKVQRVADKFIQYGECVDLEIDTEKGTITVLKAR